MPESNPSPAAPDSPSNVDPAELEKFGALAAHWWDPESEFKPLHAINPLRLDWVQSLAGPLAGRRVLDVGCGGGILAESMAADGAQVMGIDLSDKALAVARLHGLESGITVDYREISAETLAQSHPGHFDVVTCMEMLEHVPDPAAIVAACARMVRPDGWVFFSTLNRNAKSFLYAIVAAEYLLRLLPRGTHRHDSFIRPSELARACRAAGLDVVQTIGLSYQPVTQHYALSPDTSVNYLLAARPARPTVT